MQSYVDSGSPGRNWNDATSMVIRGKAGFQVMGDWAKGEFVAAKKTPDTDFLCYRFPGTDGSVVYNSDMFGMFNVPDDRKAAQVALATATLSKSFQSAFNVVKGSVPARTDVPDTDFDACGKKGIADLKAANEGGTLFGSLAQGYGAPPAIANAYKDVVSKFVHGQIKTSDEAVKQLVQAIDDAR
jgi:glucose/mannose transport system substrate-binding protein